METVILTLYNEDGKATKNHAYIPIEENSNYSDYRAYYEIANINTTSQRLMSIKINTGICASNADNNVKMTATISAILYSTAQDAVKGTNPIGTAQPQDIETTGSGSNYDFTFSELNLTNITTLYVAFTCTDRGKASDGKWYLLEIWSKETGNIIKPTVTLVFTPKNLVYIYKNETDKWKPHTVYIYKNSTDKWKPYIPYIYDGTQWVPYASQ